MPAVRMSCRYRRPATMPAKKVSSGEQSEGDHVMAVCTCAKQGLCQKKREG